MGKQLILFRHGKSNWDADYATDLDRPLAKRGIKAAKAMGKLLRQADHVPQVVRSSPAVRARTTAELAHKAGDWDCLLTLAPELYETTPDRMLTYLKTVPDSIDRLLLVGHEPTWSELTLLLMGGGQVQVPTAALVGLELAIGEWGAIEPGCGCLRWLLLPRLLA
ncbi:MAG: SixA phosphatase family protein [Prochlorothrix sp.]